MRSHTAQCINSWTLILILAFDFGTALAQSNDDRAIRKDLSDGSVLRLTLDVVEPPKTDLAQTKIKLTVTNTSSKSIAVDTELSAGFGLSFTTDLSDKGDPDDPFFSPDHDVDRKEIKKLAKPSRQDVMKRFVRLEPGQSVTRIFDLSRPLVAVTRVMGLTGTGSTTDSTTRPK